ncbi:hypothetical protein PWT90_01119 [Aphanocladium album]|nr:hypothetical protein PWT90_01119 [Aphanocladium album]
MAIRRSVTSRSGSPPPAPPPSPAPPPRQRAISPVSALSSAEILARAQRFFHPCNLTLDNVRAMRRLDRVFDVLDIAEQEFNVRGRAAAEALFDHEIQRPISPPYVPAADVCADEDDEEEGDGEEDEEEYDDEDSEDDEEDDDEDSEDGEDSEDEDSEDEDSGDEDSEDDELGRCAKHLLASVCKEVQNYRKTRYSPYQYGADVLLRRDWCDVERHLDAEAAALAAGYATASPVLNLFLGVVAHNMDSTTYGTICYAIRTCAQRERMDETARQEKEEARRRRYGCGRCGRRACVCAQQQQQQQQKHSLLLEPFPTPEDLDRMDGLPPVNALGLPLPGAAAAAEKLEKRAARNASVWKWLKGSRNASIWVELP